MGISTLIGIVLFVALALTAGQSSEQRGDAVLTITAGGTYSGTWRSTNQQPAVRIRTTEPVVIRDSAITNTGGGPLVVADWPLAVDVTLRRVRALGGSGRFLEAEGFESIRVVNCTIERTAGIKLVRSEGQASVVITKNRQRNIQGPSQGAKGFTQFVQLVEVQTAAIDISWNEIVNEFGRSEVEDVISLFKTAHARVHDNYIQGGYPLTNTSDSSASGITVEVGDAIGPTSFDNLIFRNQVIDNVGGIGLAGGRDNVAHSNRVVQDGKLGGGSPLAASNVGLAVWNSAALPGFVNNRAYANVVGFVHAGGHRNDMWFPDSPGDYRLNKRIRGRVDHRSEQLERKAWLRKLAATRVRIGA